MIQNDLNLILPEILLSIFAMLALLFGVYRGQDKKTATLTLAAPGATNSLGANKAIVIDTQSPTVASVTSTSNDGEAKALLESFRFPFKKS